MYDASKPTFMQGHCIAALGRTHSHCVLQKSPVSSVPAADAFCAGIATVYHCKMEACIEHLRTPQTVKQGESAAMVILKQCPRATKVAIWEHRCRQERQNNHTDDD